MCLLIKIYKKKILILFNEWNKPNCTKQYNKQNKYKNENIHQNNKKRTRTQKYNNIKSDIVYRKKGNNKENKVIIIK